MKLHANARTCPKSRRLLVDRLEGEWSLTEAAEAAGVSERTAAKWLARWRAEGEAGLLRPQLGPEAGPLAAGGRSPGGDRGAAAAADDGGGDRRGAGDGALSTVSRWLTRIGLGKRSRLAPPEPPNRYERKRPGELIHVDIKKLGRIQGGAGKRVRGGRRSPL